MNALNEILETVVSFVFGYLPFTREVAKQWLYDHGMGPTWLMARDYLFHYKTWIFGLLPCLLLEAWMPAALENESRRASRLLDFLYPVLGAIVLAPFATVMISGIVDYFHATLPFLNTGLLSGKPMWLQVTGAFLIADVTFYFAHFLRHKIRWFWYFHAIHHAQENLNPMTVHRVHGFEAIINTVIRTIPIAFVGGSKASWTVYIILNGFWGYFLHANIRTNLGPLGYVIVSPQFHRVHHSMLPEHADKNFGERLVLWDWLFGTMVADFSTYPPTGVRGMERWAVESKATPGGLLGSWIRQVVYPFVKIGQSLRSMRAVQLARRTPSVQRAAEAEDGAQT